MNTPRKDVTVLLNAASGGDAQAPEKLLELVYEDLRRLAEAYMNNERSDHTLQPTALVHEAFIRLVDWENVSWQSRAQFFSVAAKVMRRILVDHARAHGAEKRGGAAERLSLETAVVATGDGAGDLLMLDQALSKLAASDARKTRVVEMRFFAGMTEQEIAAVLKVDEKTVQRDWQFARMWLYRELSVET